MLKATTEAGIRILTIENGKTNSLTMPDLLELKSQIAAVDTDDSLKGLILTGAGRIFSSGFDLPMFLSFADMTSVVDFFNVEEHILLDLFTCRKPVVAALNGHTVAGGLILAMACDYRLLQDQPKIKIGMTEIKIGLPLCVVQAGIMRFGLDSNLKFQNVMYFGEMNPPEKALSMGLVDEIVTSDQLLPRAIKIITEWIDTPGRPFMALKQALRREAADNMRAALARGEWHAELNRFFTPEVRETLEFIQATMQ